MTFDDINELQRNSFEYKTREDRTEGEENENVSERQRKNKFFLLEITI